MTDIRGVEIKQGDVVIALRVNYSHTLIAEEGTVVGFTPQMVKVILSGVGYRGGRVVNKLPKFIVVK